MPYIEPYERQFIDCIIQLMADKKISADGDLNYILYRYCKYHIPKDYNSLKNYIGELRQCATEIERRILAEYEDEKIKSNGDI